MPLFLAFTIVSCLQIKKTQSKVVRNLKAKLPHPFQKSLFVSMARIKFRLDVNSFFPLHYYCMNKNTKNCFNSQKQIQLKYLETFDFSTSFTRLSLQSVKTYLCMKARKLNKISVFDMKIYF